MDLVNIWLLRLHHYGSNLDYRPDNHVTVQLFYLYFPPLKIVSRWRDPQLQVSENYSDLTK